MKLTLIDKAFLLKKTSLFESLDLDLLLTIADQSEILSHKKGDNIFQLDQNSNRIYFIISGQVEIQDMENKKITQLNSGDFFGEENLFQQQPREYKAISTTQLSLLALSCSHLLSIMLECPTVAIALLEEYMQNAKFRER